MLCKNLIPFFLILQLTSICTMMTKQLIQQDNQEAAAAAAATFIPFIMNLIKPSLSRKEKLNISQNVYNAFMRKKQEERIINENKEKAFWQNEEKFPKFHSTQNLHKNKPYFLRF